MDDVYEQLTAQLAARAANEASNDWRCPGCGLTWDEIPLGHYWTYAGDGNCGTTKPVSPAEFLRNTTSEP